MYYIISTVKVLHIFNITGNFNTTITNIHINTIYWYKNNITFFDNIYFITIKCIKSISGLYY